jgi:putative Mg2+ transporter-C (MgtC) family protein
MPQPVLTDFVDIALRLVLAIVCGGIIGRNRDLHCEGAGPRTFWLVALGTAGAAIGMLLLLGSEPGNIGRLVQAMVAGIGFPGAGVIMRRPDEARVTGPMTAAAIWFVAGLAILCGIGNFPRVGLLLAMAIALFVGGRRIELLMKGIFGKARDEDDDDSARPPAPSVALRRLNVPRRPPRRAQSRPAAALHAGRRTVRSLVDARVGTAAAGPGAAPRSARTTSARACRRARAPQSRSPAALTCRRRR